MAVSHKIAAGLSRDDLPKSTEGKNGKMDFLNILIVDDSAAIRKVLIRVLRQTELPLGDIREASDGQEAIEKLEEGSAGLILSDINMPNMDGLQLLSRLRSEKRWQSIPVIMITTEGNKSSVLQAVELGAQGYVRKPFTAEQIKDKITSCMRLTR
jgi:two-component system, chemotaxis family, chemotaxis protein CheY